MKAIKKDNMVQHMRSIRDQLNKELEGMDYEEEKAYIKRELVKLKKNRKKKKAGKLENNALKD